MWNRRKSKIGLNQLQFTGGPILISTKLDRLYPTVAIQGNVSVEANFGENLAVKPFKFEIDKYLDSVFK
jgi:hypothetical protein